MSIQLQEHSELLLNADATTFPRRGVTARRPLLEFEARVHQAGELLEAGLPGDSEPLEAGAYEVMAQMVRLLENPCKI